MSATKTKFRPRRLRVEVSGAYLDADHLARLFTALTRFSANWHALTQPANYLRVSVPRVDVEATGLADRLLADRSTFIGTSVQVHRVEIGSPGFISVEAGGTLEKLVEILHSGDLAREERKAIIERVRAETRLISAKALDKDLEAMSRAVTILEGVDYPSEQIRAMLVADGGRFRRLLTEPVEEVEELLTSGVIDEVRMDDHDEK